jgi:hypothetical protein
LNADAVNGFRLRPGYAEPVSGAPKAGKGSQRRIVIIPFARRFNQNGRNGGFVKLRGL